MTRLSRYTGRFGGSPYISPDGVQLIRDALRMTDTVAEAAASLGTSRRTLHRWMSRLGIASPRDRSACMERARQSRWQG